MEGGYFLCLSLSIAKIFFCVIISVTRDYRSKDGFVRCKNLGQIVAKPLVEGAAIFLCLYVKTYQVLIVKLLVRSSIPLASPPFLRE